MEIFQKPNKRLMATLAAGAAVLLFRKKKLLSGLSQLLFIASLRQWSKAEYVSGANTFRKALGAAGIFVAQTFATYRLRNKKK